ncbi:MAG: endonuclease/exonuclease/phosphatase family protein [Phycisphaeraceae bacterium]|nr:endonuclease/exonuclease/phosphatase family protein [Phycisphaeraceae bacterium]
MNALSGSILLLLASSILGCGMPAPGDPPAPARVPASGTAPPSGPAPAPAPEPVAAPAPMPERVPAPAPAPERASTAAPAPVPVPIPTPEASPSADIRVISFNIRYANERDGDHRWERRRDHVIDLLRAGAYDFIGLQEALSAQVREIADALPEYGMIVRARSVSPTGGEACPLLYRRSRWTPDPADQGTFWLSDTPETAGSRHWGNTMPRIATFARFMERGGARSVVVMNTHFDHESDNARRRSAVLIAERLKAWPALPRIVMGDFNVHLDGPVLEPVRRIGLVDSFRTRHPTRTGEVSTYHGFKGVRIGARIDGIFVSSDAEVLDAEIVYESRDGIWPSDHYPVTAVIRLPAAGRPATAP